MGCRSYNFFLAGLEELREFDPRMQGIFAKVDMKFFGVYRDAIHHNDGIHLDGGIELA